MDFLCRVSFGNVLKLFGVRKPFSGVLTCQVEAEEVTGGCRVCRPSERSTPAPDGLLRKRGLTGAETQRAADRLLNRTHFPEQIGILEAEAGFICK